MLSLPGSVRIFVAREPVDFRKGFDGLCGIVRDHFGDDPLSGHLFVFFNRRRDRVKLLFWDRNGLWVLYKRLERGTFAGMPGGEQGGARVEVDRARLHLLLDGAEISGIRYRKHFREPLCLAPRRRALRRNGSPPGSARGVGAAAPLRGSAGG